MDWSVYYPAKFPKRTAVDGTAETIDTHDLPKVEFADVGCGFGGLLMAIAPMFPDTLMLGECYMRTIVYMYLSPLPLPPLGMEIRMSVTQFVADKIAALRIRNAPIVLSLPMPSATVESEGSAPETTAAATLAPGGYQNVSVVRANAMKFFPNFFEKAQVR